MATGADAAEPENPHPRRRLRLLPWTGPEDKPCFLITDGDGGRVSRLADIAEEVQLEMGARLLAHAEDMLTNATEAQLRFLAERLTEALRDSLRIAESRWTGPCGNQERSCR
nr:hypothetical protein [Streptomyces africanus]